MKKIKLNIQIFMEIVIIFLCSLTPIFWLSKGQIILGHDSGFRPDVWTYLGDIFQTWYRRPDFGIDYSIFKGFLITQFPEAFFSFLFPDMTSWQTATFIFWFFVVGISMYIAIRMLFSESEQWFIRLYTSLFYMYNFFLLQGWFIVERAKFSLFAALPLVFVLYLKTLNGLYPIFKASILISLILFFLNGGGSPPLYGAIIVTLITTTLFLFFRQPKGMKLRFFGRLLRFVPTVLTVIFALNAYYLLPLIQLSANQYQANIRSLGGIEGILSWEMMVNKYATIGNLLRLQGIPDWYTGNHPFSEIYLHNPFLVILSFIPVFSIIVGLITIKFQKRNVEPYHLILFLVLLFVSLFFTSGSQSPLGFLYILCIKYIPGFAIFRSGFYKFGPAYMFSIIVLSGIFYHLLVNLFIKKRIIRIVLFIAILFYIPLYHYPFFSGEVFDWNKPFSTKLSVPDYVYDMQKYIHTALSPDERILLFPPTDGRIHADSYTWGFWSLDSLPRLLIHNPVVADDESPFIKSLYQSIYTGNYESFLKMSEMGNIRKILYRKDVLFTDKTTTSQDFDRFITGLSKAGVIIKEKSFGEWMLYVITPSAPHSYVYIPEEISIVEGESNAIEDIIGFSDISSKEYIVTHNNSAAFVESAKKIASELIVQTDCQHCDNKRLMSIDMPSKPSIRFLPDSPLYQLIQYKEYKTLNSFSENPAQRINAQLVYTTKRLVEIEQMAKMSPRSESKDELIKTNLNRYIDGMDRIFHDVVQLGRNEKNSFGIKINSYLILHQSILSNVRNNDAGYQQLFSYVFDQIVRNRNQIASMIWVSDETGMYRYFVSIPRQGEYEVIHADGSDNPILFKDENIVGNPVFLNNGDHSFSVIKDLPKNLMRTVMPEATYSVTLQTGESKSLPFPGVHFYTTYFGRIQYMVPQGNSIILSFNQNNDEIQNNQIYRKFANKLEDNGKIHEIFFVLEPNKGVQTAEFHLTSQSIGEKDSTVQFQKFELIEQNNPDIYLKKNEKRQIYEPPGIRYVMESSNLHRVDIENATESFILTQKEAYSPKWVAYTIDTDRFRKIWTNNTGVIAEIQHLLLYPLLQYVSDGILSVHGVSNTVFNSWVIDKSGSYSVLLVYTPHIYASVGCIISIFSLCLIAAYMLRRRTHENNH